MSWLFALGSQSIGASASVLVFPVNIQGWCPLGLIGLILQSKQLSRVFSSTTIRKHQFFVAQPSLQSNSHPYITTGKNIALNTWTFVSKLMSRLYNILSRYVMAFLPGSKCLLILWLKSPSTVILEPKKIKCHFFHVPPIYSPPM